METALVVSDNLSESVFGDADGPGVAVLDAGCGGVAVDHSDTEHTEGSTFDPAASSAPWQSGAPGYVTVIAEDDEDEDDDDFDGDSEFDDEDEESDGDAESEGEDDDFLEDDDEEFGDDDGIDDDDGDDDDDL